MAFFGTNIGTDDADRKRPVSWFEARRRGLGDIGCGYWHGKGGLYPKTRLGRLKDRIDDWSVEFARTYWWLPWVVSIFALIVSSLRVALSI